MAGVTDAPFRRLCVGLGAGLAVSEMISADVRLYRTEKTRRRLSPGDECRPRSVQIAGADPGQMALAARLNVDRGAEIIDINMGCPAKKVCKVAAGSALLKDEGLVGRILQAVVAAVDVPVTLKLRTGWDRAHRNGVRVACIAEHSGIAALAVHGRTRQCGFGGEVDYQSIAEIKASVGLPVMANGDITSAAQARQVLDRTGADAVMIGRGAQGNPWLFREIDIGLRTGAVARPPSLREVRDTLLEHLQSLYSLYGRHLGVRVARKHLGWYCKRQAGARGFWRSVNRVEDCDRQLALTRSYFNQLLDKVGNPALVRAAG